jgi:hypothetical protein
MTPKMENPEYINYLLGSFEYPSFIIILYT